MNFLYDLSCFFFATKLYKNVEQIFAKFAKEGKATIWISNPADSIAFSKVSVSRTVLYCFGETAAHCICDNWCCMVFHQLNTWSRGLDEI